MKGAWSAAAVAATAVVVAAVAATAVVVAAAVDVATDALYTYNVIHICWNRLECSVFHVVVLSAACL